MTAGGGEGGGVESSFHAKKKKTSVLRQTEPLEFIFSRLSHPAFLHSIIHSLNGV